MNFHLKPIPDEDVDAFFDMVRDPSLSFNTGSIPVGIDRDWAVNRLKERRAEEEKGTRADRGLYDGETLVGIASWFYNEHGHMEIGYAIHRDHRGNGLATRAAVMIVDMLQNDGFTGPIYAQYYQDNEASGRVLEKLGFEKDVLIEEHSAVRGGMYSSWIVKLEP